MLVTVPYIRTVPHTTSINNNHTRITIHVTHTHHIFTHMLNVLLWCLCNHIHMHSSLIVTYHTTHTYNTHVIRTSHNKQLHNTSSCWWHSLYACEWSGTSECQLFCEQCCVCVVLLYMNDIWIGPHKRSDNVIHSVKMIPTHHMKHEYLNFSDWNREWGRNKIICGGTVEILKIKHFGGSHMKIFGSFAINTTPHVYQSFWNRSCKPDTKINGFGFKKRNRK